MHATGRPVLVGTASVEESERLSRKLADVPHQVLNARHEEAEAAIVERAGAARRRDDLDEHGRPRRRHPAGTGRRRSGRPARDRHEPAREPANRSSAARPRGPAGRSRQLAVLRVARGSAGGEVRRRRSRGCAASIVREPCDALQRVAEGQSFDIRLFLRKYESLVEGQRLEILERRQDVLTGAAAVPVSSSNGWSRWRRSTISGPTTSRRRTSFAPARSGSRWPAPIHSAITSAACTRCFRSSRGRSRRKYRRGSRARLRSASIHASAAPPGPT